MPREHCGEEGGTNRQRADNAAQRGGQATSAGRSRGTQRGTTPTRGAPHGAAAGVIARTPPPPQTPRRQQRRPVGRLCSASSTPPCFPRTVLPPLAPPPTPQRTSLPPHRHAGQVRYHLLQPSQRPVPVRLEGVGARRAPQPQPLHRQQKITKEVKVGCVNARKDAWVCGGEHRPTSQCLFTRPCGSQSVSPPLTPPHATVTLPPHPPTPPPFSNTTVD